MRDRRTGVSYQWPSPSQLSSVRQLGCNIVPAGFTHPRRAQVNPDSEIEWEVYFTKAELLLTRTFHHPKV